MPVLNDHLGDAYWRAGPQAGGHLPVEPCARHEAGPGRAGRSCRRSSPKACRRSRTRPRRRAAEDGCRPSRQAAEPRAGREKRTEAPASQPADSAQPPIPAAYKVLPGQSLWSIAADELGSGSRYIEILDLNPQLQRRSRPASMPGQELTLPGAESSWSICVRCLRPALA